MMMSVTACKGFMQFVFHGEGPRVKTLKDGVFRTIGEDETPALFKNTNAALEAAGKAFEESQLETLRCVISQYEGCGAYTSAFVFKKEEGLIVATDYFGKIVYIVDQ